MINKDLLKHLDYTNLADYSYSESQFLKNFWGFLKTMENPVAGKNDFFT